MTRSDLPENFIDSPEAILRRSRTRTTSSRTTSPATSPPSIDDLVHPEPSTTTTMAKTLYKYSVPDVANVSIGPAVDTGYKNFELRTGLTMMVQANQFHGLPSEDTNAHLQHFLELYNTIVIKDVAPASIKLCLFPFSLWRKSETMVLQGKGSCQHVGQMFHSVPRQVRPREQNQCPKEKNSQLSVEHHRVNSRGMGKTTRLHPSMPTPRHR